jgi:Flp pilus assembly protein TadG
MLKRFRKDETGVAAVEFAILFPIMLLLYFGTVEVTMAFLANGRASHVASVVGDLVTQTPSVKQTDMDDIFTVGDSIMKPFPATSLKLRITSITADPSSGTPKVIWSYAKGLTKSPVGNATGFPAGLLAASESMIQADVEYTYTSPVQQTLPNPLTFKTTYYIKPRRSSEVVWDSTP